MLEGHTENLSTTDAYLGLVTLQYLKDTRGVTAECYNKHYLFSELYGMSYIDLLSVYDTKIETDLVSDKGNDNLQTMPVVTPLDTMGWIVTCSDTTFNGYKTKGAAWLLDGNGTTCFEPGITSSISVIEVQFDMKKEQMLHGFKVMQPAPATATELVYLLHSLKIEVSNNGYSWEKATYEDGGIAIGNALGETTFINIPEEKQKPVRYIRLTMNNRQVSATTDKIALFSLRLGDVIPY